MWHFIKGYRNAPKHARLAGALTAARMRSPILGGNFGVWGGLFSVFDCSLAHYRGVEDPWNAIMAGGLTGGLLAARAGASVASFDAARAGAARARKRNSCAHSARSPPSPCHSGPKAIARNAMVGAVLLALIEGVGIAINKAVMRMQMEQMAGGHRVDTLEPPIPPGFGSRNLAEYAAGLSGSAASEDASFQLR